MRNRRFLYIKKIYINILYLKAKYKIRVIILKKEWQKRRKICGWVIPSDEQANEMIAEMIRKGAPFCLLRPGHAEFEFARLWDERAFFGTEKYREPGMYGVFDNNDGYAERWVRSFEEDLKEADILAYFDENSYTEDYLTEAYADPKHIILLRQIEVMQMEKPWLLELKGKKVLVISPFAETMEKQYQRRDMIWGGREILPEMDIRFLKSVWYINKGDNSGFDNWFAALDYLLAEASKIDFDIALIGCGPFSTFLAARFKREGKQAIQYGGALQMLFGIRGARWDNMEKYRKYFNECWVRPPKEEAPDGSAKLDNKCYW